MNHLLKEVSVESPSPVTVTVCYAVSMFLYRDIVSCVILSNEG